MKIATLKMKKRPIVIIGSGLAGYLFAKEFRKLDTKTPLEIITANDGVFYSKPLLSTALTNKKSISELAVYSANEMSSRLQARIHIHTPIESVDLFSKTIQVRKEKIAYQKLIMACGSKSMVPTLQGDAIFSVTSVNDLATYEKFRAQIQGKQSIAIFGAGLVGCEFANDLINVGYHVDVVSPDPYPLAKFVPEPVGHILQRALADIGVNWHLNKIARAVNSDRCGYQITFMDGKSIWVDRILSAIGIRPQCGLAKIINLECNFGIVVDRHLQTSIENIYALGDCAEVAGKVHQYVAPLLRCAKALARHLVGDESLVQYPPMPVIVKTPACAISAYPPFKKIEGKWQYLREGNHQQALFYDREGKLQGFALSGDYITESMSFTQQLSSVF